MFSHQKSSPSKSKLKSKDNSTKEDGDDEKETGSLPEVGSQFSSSCEIFSLFKVLAAGKKGKQPFHAEVDSDESEEEPESQPRSSVSTSTSTSESRDEASLKHVASARTVRQSDVLHDDEDSEAHEEEPDDRETLVEGGMDKEEALRRWQDSFGSTNADLDAQGNRLAGESHC